MDRNVFNSACEVVCPYYITCMWGFLIDGSWIIGDLEAKVL